MSLTIGRLALDDPEAFAEAVGEQVARVGSTPVPGGRTGLSTTANLTSFPATDGSVANDRRRVRRQLRSLLNNLPMCRAGVYVAWSDDDELSGWYAPGQATFDVAGPAALTSAFWRFTGLELALIGRIRTDRRGVLAYLRDRRVATQPRDTLARVYSTNFSGMTPTSLTWLPSTVSDVLLSTGAVVTLTSALAGYGGSSLRAVVGLADLAAATFEQAAADRNLGDVVILDRRGTITAPTGGPDAAWEEVYGQDYPLSAGDVPVVENSLSRVRYSSANTPGFAVDRWTGAAWAEAGKVIIERIGDTTGFLDTLVSAQVLEWTADRAVIRAVMRRAADAPSREEVYLTLQRGWTGPRIEVYPAKLAAGTPAGAGIHVFRVNAPAGTDTAEKFDATLQTQTGSPSFTGGAAVGAATFTGENWLSMRRTGEAAINLVVVQNGAAGRVENNSSAYGSARNGISVRQATFGYISAHIGMNGRSDATAIDATAGTTYDGARDLGKAHLMDSRSPQVVVSR